MVGHAGADTASPPGAVGDNTGGAEAGAGAGVGRGAAGAGAGGDGGTDGGARAGGGGGASVATVGETLLRHSGRMETKWGYVETNAQGVERAAAIQIHAALLEATVAHMGGIEVVGQSTGEEGGGAVATAGEMAEMMAEAGCLVPSLMATTCERQRSGLKQLVE